MHRFFLFYFLTLPLANSQARIGEWKALTSILNVRDIISTEEAIYAASGGGILEIKNIDGKKTNDIQVSTLNSNE